VKQQSVWQVSSKKMADYIEDKQYNHQSLNKFLYPTNNYMQLTTIRANSAKKLYL
jgi:hypothetical protein